MKKEEEEKFESLPIDPPAARSPTEPADQAAPVQKSTVSMERSGDYAPYPKLDPADLEVPPPPPPPPSSAPGIESKAAAPAHSGSSPAATSMPAESNPYVTSAPATSSSSKVSLDSVRDVLGRWGKKAVIAAKMTEELAGNVWQHLKTGPSVADAAMGRIAQSTKVLAEGGYEKIFRQTFDTLPDEQLKKTYACYLSTSAGPVIGILYLSSVKLAFCSDNPLSYKVADKTEWSYYKVVIPLHQLRTVNPSVSKVNPAEKYIQVVSVDNHEFWFMGFVNYDCGEESPGCLSWAGFVTVTKFHNRFQIIYWSL